MKIKLIGSTVEDIILTGLLVFAPLALGAVSVWAYCVTAMISLTVFNLHFLNRVPVLRESKFQNLNETVSLAKVLRLPITIGLLVFLAINTFYIIPLPSGVIKLLSPSAYSLRKIYTLAHSSWQTLSVYPRATTAYLIKLTTYIMVFLTITSKILQRPPANHEYSSKKVPSIVRSRYCNFVFLGALMSVLSILFHNLVDFNLRITANALYFTVMLALIAGLSNSRSKTVNYSFLRRIVNAVVIIGFVVAVFGIVQRLNYNGNIYWVIRCPGVHFGPYINYDHYAGFMGMCVFLSLANFITHITNSAFPYIRKFKDKILWFSTKEAGVTLINLFMAVVMVTALFMTTSRGGIMSFCAAFTIFYFICIITSESRKRKRILLATLFIIILVVIMVVWIGPEKTLDKFKLLSKAVKAVIVEKAVLNELRPHMWKDTLQLVKDYPFFGSGAGTYYIIFSKYRTFTDSLGLLRYAHNDYLQVVSEIGVFGVLSIICFFVWYLRRIMECIIKLKETWTG